MLNEIRKRMKYIKTFNLYLSLFTLGMSLSMTGPCLLDLQHMVHTDTQRIAMIYTAKSTGYIFGAIIGGVLLDLIRFKQAVLMVCYFVVTATIIGIPWARNVDLLMTVMCINGFFLGALETGGNVVCLNLWGKDSNPIFQGLHFTFSFGGLIAPLMAAPFLENFKELTHDIDGTLDNATYIDHELVNSTSKSFNVSSNIVYTSENLPKIIYPFSIVGMFGILNTSLQLIICIISPTEDESTKDASKTENVERSFMFMFFIVTLTFILFFVVAGIEIGYGQTLTIFSVKSELHLTKTRGSYVTSAFWAAFTVTRLLCVFLSMKISYTKIIIGDICLVAVAALILLFLMPNEWALWLASVVFGIGIAPAYATLVGWLNTYINISNKFSAIFTVGCAAGEMIVPFVITYFIDTIPEMLAFVTTAAAILTATLFFIMYCMLQKDSNPKEPKNIQCYVTEVSEARQSDVAS